MSVGKTDKHSMDIIMYIQQSTQYMSELDGEEMHLLTNFLVRLYLCFYLLGADYIFLPT